MAFDDQTLNHPARFRVNAAVAWGVIVWTIWAVLSIHPDVAIAQERPQKFAKVDPSAVQHSTTAQAQVLSDQRAAPTVCGISGFDAALLTMINRARAQGANCGEAGNFPAGSALKWDPALAHAAAAHAADMAARNYLSHTGIVDGKDPGARMAAAGYDWSDMGENIGRGRVSPDFILARWLASPRHCANVMNPNFTDVGVSCALAAPNSSHQSYWTMTLGGR